MDFKQYYLTEAQFRGEVSVAQASSTAVWNRLEVTPRNPQSNAAFKAEVRDALWMLTRQWQLGEFIGEDAGTMMFTNLKMHCHHLDAPAAMPLETQVEQRPLFENTSRRAANIDWRVQMGLYWLKLLRKHGFADEAVLYAEYEPYMIVAPEELNHEGNALQLVGLMQGRCLDGWIFFNDTDRFQVIPSANRSKIKTLFGKMESWYARQVQQPAADSGNWKPENLEYGFSTSLPLKNLSGSSYKQVELGTDEYYQGRLDWYNFDARSQANLNSSNVRQSPTEMVYPDASNRQLIPGPVAFSGMPEKRYWQFEEGATNFASVQPDKLDLGKMALIEFGLVYGNDWNLVPLKVPMGSFLQVEKLEVVDSFGKITVIPALGTAAGTHWDSWQYFKLANNSGASMPDGILMAPVAASIQHAKPLEEVVFVRDEVANVIWGIETVVPDVLGKGKSGREIGMQEKPISKNIQLTYQAQSDVPRNWIPFIPVKPSANSRVALRRGSMKDENGERIRPYTSLLRLGIDEKDAQSTSFDLDENEVGREGVVVRKAFQRTRWTNGEVFVWLGISKQAGKGEAASNLTFDKLI